MFPKNNKGKWLVRGRKMTSLSRSFSLPEDVKSEEIKSVVKEGILSPRSEKHNHAGSL